jgi:hypothetical protein
MIVQPDQGPFESSAGFASLRDPAGLFNAGLDGRERRAIDIAEGDGSTRRPSRPWSATRRGSSGRRLSTANLNGV